MGIGKWIAGALGFMTMGPLGGLAAFVLGHAFEKLNEGKHGEPGIPAGEGGAQGQRNSFMFSMLVLASYIMKADGKVMHSEMETMRRFLRSNFGASAEVQGEQIIRRLFERRKEMDRQNPDAFRNTIRDCASQMADNLTYEARLQLLEFLIEIVKADGRIAPEEVTALHEVAVYMRIPVAEVDSMLNLGGGGSLDDDYKVLEVSPTATNDEVKAAYRKMALKHHPDKVAMLGEDVRRAAEKKFQEINAAKERIYKARGMS